MCGFPIRKATGYGQAHLVCASKLRISMCGFPIHEAMSLWGRGARNTERFSQGRARKTASDDRNMISEGMREIDE